MGMNIADFPQEGRGGRPSAALRLRFGRISWQPSLPTERGAAVREARSSPCPDQNSTGFSVQQKAGTPEGGPGPIGPGPTVKGRPRGIMFSCACTNGDPARALVAGRGLGDRDGAPRSRSVLTSEGRAGCDGRSPARPERRHGRGRQKRKKHSAETHSAASPV